MFTSKPTTVTFPRSFGGTAYIAVANKYRGSMRNWQPEHETIASNITSSSSLTIASNETADGTITVQWLAIGPL